MSFRTILTPVGQPDNAESAMQAAFLVARRFAGEKPGEFVAPHGCAVDSRGDLYVAEVSWTAKGSQENPPREIRSLQKFERV